MDKIIQFFRQPVDWLYSFELWIILLITIVSLALILTIVLLVIKKIKKIEEKKLNQSVKSVNVVVKDKAPQQDVKPSADKAAPEKEEELKDDDIYVKQPEKKPEKKPETKPVASGSVPKINSKDEFDFDLDEFDIEVSKGKDILLSKEEMRLGEIADGTPVPEPKLYEAVLNNISKTDDVNEMVKLADIDEDKKEVSLSDEAGFITDTKEVNVITEDINETEIEDNKPVGGDLSELDFDDITISKQSNSDNEFDVEELDSIYKDDDEQHNSSNEFDLSEFDITEQKPTKKDGVLATEKEDTEEEKILKGAKAVPAIKVIPKKPRKEPVAKETPAVKKPTAPTQKAATPKSAVKPLPAAAKIKEPTPTSAPKKEPKAGSTGKFEIFKQNEKYKFSLVANNGTLLFESLSYSSLATCKNAVGTFKKNVETGEFSVEKNQNGFYYLLKKGNTIYYGVTYSTEKACKAGIESVKKFTETAVIILKD